MRVRIKIGFVRLLILTAAALGVACSAADMDYLAEDYNYVTAFGMLDVDSRSIVADNSTVLHIEEFGSQTSEKELLNHKERVLFNYTVLGNSTKGGFDIRLNCFYPLEIEDMELFCPRNSTAQQMAAGGVGMEWKDEDFISLIDAPAMPCQVIVSGGYVNIEVCYYSTLKPSQEMPDVELYYDMNSSTEDTAVLQLSCESDDEMYQPNASAQFQWFSFRIIEEVEQKMNEADIYAFYWCWWTDSENPKAGKSDYTSIMSSVHGNSSLERMVDL